MDGLACFSSQTNPIGTISIRYYLISKFVYNSFDLNCQKLTNLLFPKQYEFHELTSHIIMNKEFKNSNQIHAACFHCLYVIQLKIVVGNIF